MKFDRQKFFAGFKNEFGKLSNYQIDGLNRLLRLYEKYEGWWDSIDEIANSLSQIKLETANSFNPVVEGYYLGDPNAKPEDYFHGNNPRVQKHQKTLKYFPYFGIGDIQLTWLDNYEKHERLLRLYFPEIVTDFEARTGQKLDLVKNPRQLLDGDISFAIMTIGMQRGTFTSKRLEHYKKPEGFDHYNARDIVNGDKNHKLKNSNLTVGDKVRNQAIAFAEILRNSLITENPLSEIQDDEIELDIPKTSSQSPNSNQTLFPDFQPNAPVEDINQPDAPLTSLVNEQSKAAGDKPETEPRSWLSVEDWKPWVFAKLKWVWSGFGAFNFTNFSGNTLAALNSGESWWIYLIIAAILFIGAIVICAVISLILLIIWYLNRKEIVHYKSLAQSSVLDPNSFNLGLKFEKIGVK